MKKERKEWSHYHGQSLKPRVFAGSHDGFINWSFGSSLSSSMMQVRRRGKKKRVEPDWFLFRLHLPLQTHRPSKSIIQNLARIGWTLNPQWYVFSLSPPLSLCFHVLLALFVGDGESTFFVYGRPGKRAMQLLLRSKGMAEFTSASSFPPSASKQPVVQCYVRSGMSGTSALFLVH